MNFPGYQTAPDKSGYKGSLSRIHPALFSSPTINRRGGPQPAEAYGYPVILSILLFISPRFRAGWIGWPDLSLSAGLTYGQTAFILSNPAGITLRFLSVNPAHPCSIAIDTLIAITPQSTLKLMADQLTN